MSADNAAENRSITACPGCGSARSTLHRSPSVQNDGESKEYLCRKCDERFEEPATRPTQNPAPGRSGLSQTLADADPDTPLSELAASGGEQP